MRFAQDAYAAWAEVEADSGQRLVIRTGGIDLYPEGSYAWSEDYVRSLEEVGGIEYEWLDAAANARLIKNAEAYYRVMYYGSAESWNLRDTHMFETLCQLLDAKGPEAKAIVWAHNSHIGNAAFTEMGQAREELALALRRGQPPREDQGVVVLSPERPVAVQDTLDADLGAHRWLRRGPPPRGRISW